VPVRGLAQDLRDALRVFRRNPGFAAAAVATLALGIGGNAAIFSIVDRIAVRSLPFPHSDRLVRVRDTILAPGGQFYKPQVLPPHWDAIAQGTRSFDQAFAELPQRLTWIGGDSPESFEGVRISAGTLQTLGVAPAQGRLFTRREEELGDQSEVALVSDRFWRTRLGGRRDVLGSSLRLADQTATIIGVLPPGFRFPYASDVWRPLTVDPAGNRDLFVIARLAPGVTLESARSEMNALARRLEIEGPVFLKGRGIDLTPLRINLVGGEERVPFAMMASVGFLLLLGCANLGALALARSIERQGEMGIRAALGASRARQIQRVLCETLLLSAVGGIAGLALASATAGPLTALLPRAFVEDLPLSPADTAPAVALFALALSTLTGLVFGLAPAWGGSRSDPISALRRAGRGTSLAPGSRRLHSTLVATEIALATLLLGGAALMWADFVDRQNRDLGLRPDHLYSAEIPLRNAAGDSPERRRQLAAEVLRSAAGIPGVASVALTTANPFSERQWGVRIAPEGKTLDPTRELSTVNLRLVSPGLFRTWQTSLVAGREISHADRPETPSVAVVSQHLARRLWGGPSALGQGFFRRSPDGTLARSTVVGIAKDVRDFGDLRDTIYLPYDQMADLEAAETIYLMARGGSSTDFWTRELPGALARVDPRLGIAESGFMDGIYASSLRQSRLGTSIVGFFAVFGLLLAAIGVFAMVSFVALRRRSEIGIRIAVGASPQQVRRLVLGQGLLLAAAGGTVGFGLVLIANRLLGAAIADFAMRPALGAAAAAALLLVAVAASQLPARRAARLDPMTALQGN
jgi:putative ABC transport system permease protein